LGDNVLVSGNISNVGTLDITAASSIEVQGVATDFSQNYVGATTLNGDVTSNGGPITFQDAVTLTADLTVNADTGDLTFMDTVQGQAGTENLDLFGNNVDVQGAVSNLATLDVTGATSVTMN